MMLQFIVLVLSLLGLLQSAVGQIVQFGQCNPNTALALNFNIQNFEGTWYEIGRSDLATGGSDCSSFVFNVTGNNITVFNPAVNANFVENRNGTASQVQNTARLTLDLSSSDPFDFWILNTDYNIFAIAYNCVNISSTQRSINVWQLSRTTSYPNTLVPALINTTLFTNFGIEVKDLRQINHSEDACYVLPIIEQGEPIVLPGQCNENITVVQDFQVSNFTGLWHEIYSYESPNSLNLCSRAEYSLLDGVVQVVNSQVVNQTLDSITGSATLIGADGSARLNVTLNIANNFTVSQVLRVLATDYNNYAVSYSCENLSNNQMRVYSWILSRSRQLSPEAQAAVDRVIASEISLNKLYYKKTDQSDEACFFFPKPDPNKPVSFRGLCDSNITAMPNFQPANYTGIWHDIESYPSIFQTGTCRNANYQLAGGVVQVVNTQVINQTLDTVIGQAVLASVDGSGRLNVTFPIAGTNMSVTTNYVILATDYTSYSLVYSCQNLDENERQVWAWKLSRTKQLAPQASASINEVMSNITVVDQRYFHPVDQSVQGCFFYPKPVPGLPVKFPGQCNNNITVVQNFNLTLFQGIWHEIEAYPKEQQQGNCVNHNYSPGIGNSLNLQSSQIIDQFLNLSNGTFSFASTDNSARMNINITVDGETITIPFYILDIDYNDYAIAYSCVNIDSDFRSVYSWKLSRTKQLSNNAIVNINNIISQVDVLVQDYYEQISQSDEDCFYLPDLVPGEPVILFGTCDSNITAVPNFNASRYLGTWRLIESYPTEFQTGSCGQATYSSGSNGTVVVFNTQVLYQTLDTITGSAVLGSVDGSGKLLVTFPNAPNASEYLVLSTDYDSYALVYSCQNLGNDQRRVWSWKMSRTNSLSENATSAINAVVNSINVLNNRYYNKEDNTEAGCFYFPDPEYGKPVRFRARCNQNITGISNFTLANYTGLWNTIEMYPSDSQSGSCSRSVINLVQTNVVLSNIDVINQTLNTVGGSIVAASDGSGKLDVTLNLGNINRTATLHVLDTDYTSFSLLYACEEIDEEYSQVWSWKMSRTKQLTPSAIQRINNTINSYQVLDDRYYWSMDQSAEGCFYYPLPQLGVPAEFPGVCDPSIPVISNFNMSQFAGVWHEILSYPIGNDHGQCSNFESLRQIGSNLELQYSAVQGLSLNTFYGNLTFAPANNATDGRLIIYVPHFGIPLEIPFWIIDIDYEDYLFVYGCMDLVPLYPDHPSRIVYSWQFSRTKHLSANATAAINQTMNSIDVLRPQYYEHVNQSAEACFFLPEVVPGQVVVFSGTCDPNITVVQNFNVTRYLGRWYMIESYPSDFQTGSCNDARYSLGANGTVDVINTQVVNQTLDTVAGSATLASVDGSGKLLVSFPNAPEPAEYWILDTDYDSYALVYSCRNINSDQRNVWSWKLSREQSLSQNATNAMNQVIDTINVLDNRYFEAINHSSESCFYFPKPDPFTQVKMRGRCGQNITAVQNFNATRYLNLWHMIESFPSSFQTGTCANAYYSLGSAGVDVLNTQVVNQTLDTVTGLAVVASTDGSAVLNVTFPIAGTNASITTPYVVLATDYDTYALVYSCVEVDDEYKQVWSWKLSRSKQLSAAAVNSINSVTNGIRELDDRYYLNMDQSREGCFFYPKPQPGVPVRFPGQCSNITVVENFNMTLFQGIWHEIEAYPKNEQTGECVNHQYTPGLGNTLNLQSSSVSNLTLNVSNGTLSFTSSDGSARLSITINVNGTVITIPFWIVDTDYLNYALAYSCVNVNDDFREVYSWKLSRSRTMSQNASIAIDNAIFNVDVLGNQYYEKVNQSDSACFFLPDLAPGEPAVFPGQCSQNLTVVQNFNVTRYLNRWRLIESYPAEFQTGDCSEATYSLGSNGTVVVFNTQVVNETLDTITGSAVLASADGSGKLLVTFPGSPEPATYWILDTDYDSYSLVYSCRNINSEQRRVYAWKLSRDRSLSPTAINNINQVMNSIDVMDQRYFEKVAHSHEACFYYPKPNGQPVIFRGPCNTNVTVVSNFDPERYQGTWYDVGSYPQEFQDGTCPKAEYTLSDGVVNVVNSQVVAQELEVVTAVAVPAGNNTDGRLTVTFPIAGTNLTVSSPYWVLATDYSNYSLVYSCVDLDDERRRVTSWKLSRSQNLTSESSAAINAAMSQLQVLRDQYYENRGHSEDDCFFYPDNYGGPVLLSGQCVADNLVNAVNNFNASRFAGTWHEISRFPSELQNGECAASELGFNNSQFVVTYTIVANESQTLLSGQASLMPGGRGILSVNFNNSEISFNSSIYIMDVDYDEFALLYSCRNYNATHLQAYSWKLSRSRSGLSEAAQARINTTVSAEENLFHRYYEDTAQDNYACFHYPEFLELPDSILLPGPCNDTIRGVPQFNASAYLGEWFEIEKYPQPFQLGECGRAHYSTGGNVVDVLNTQVLNRTLLSQSGTAVVASNDGSGQLTVTFNVSGVINVANYYILATDYDNYALVYSCRNEGEDRRVASWKLSRSRNLSAQAIQTMDNVIANTQGLRQNYYTLTNQSAEACFYVPELDVYQAPLFRGTCDNITGVANFDVQRYLGWWHEIERYPIDSSAGDCRSTQYQQAGNQIQLIDTSVFDLNGEVTSGSVVATSDGRLRRTLSNGQVQDLWVLATDYNTYSLVFSCETVDDERVRIWSAKHSKSRQLTPAAQAAMAPIITSNDYLQPDFYLPVNQSDNACFHYPPPNGREVILPGRCDQNITVQENFDIVGFTGTWYHIERYPYPEISTNSTCVGTRYTYNDGAGIVEVLNWEVVNGQLNSVEGLATVTASSAKLQVVVPVPNSNETSTSDLYILKTDYISYSLAYTCEEINPFQRAVKVFKLSRTRNMPALATTEINNYMMTRPELHQPYFVQVPQSDDCEEPNSSIVVRSSIVVMLICYVIHMLM